MKPLTRKELRALNKIAHRRAEYPQGWFIESDDNDFCGGPFPSLVEAQRAIIKHFDNTPPYELTDAQKRFVRKARREGLRIDYGYSGRGMFGAKCPAVTVDYIGSFSFKGARSDNMGRSFVIYMP